jgi:Spy/CpxP family protein refolding chaperone
MKTNIKNLKRIFLIAALTIGGYAMADDAADMGGMPPPPAGMHAGGPDGRPGGPGMEMRDHEGPMGGPMGGPGMPPGPMAPFLFGLELSEAQQDKVFGILYAEMPYLRDQHKAAVKAHEALRTLASADKFDDAKATALAQAAAQANANIELQHVRTEQKLLALLTPEQRKQLAERQEHLDRQPHHPAHP